MNQCPRCQEWSLEYDSYFGRYRCYNPDCEWMAPSSVEREIRLLQSEKKPFLIENFKVPNTNLTFSTAYDEENDALLFDFGIKEPTYDLPEPDGRVIWKIAHVSDTVAGIVLVGAKKFGVSQVSISVKAKQNIEKIVKGTPNAFSAGRPSRILIERVELFVKLRKKPQESPCFFEQALNNFEAKFVNS